jgi:hypothetical protein
MNHTMDQMSQADYAAEMTRANGETLDNLLSHDETRQFKGRQKCANYIKHALFESSFCDAFLPPETITDNSRFLYDVGEPKLVIVDEYQAPSPGAMSVSFSGDSRLQRLDGQRFRTYIQKLTSVKYRIETDYLVTYRYDIRQYALDRMLKELQRIKDVVFINTVWKLIGQLDQPMLGTTGKVQYRDMGSAITRPAYVDAANILNGIGYDSGLTPSAILMNNITATQFRKWGRDELGGDLAQETLVNGFSKITKSPLGVDFCTTIKKSLVKDGLILYFASPEFLGVNYLWKDVTVFTKQEEDILYMNAWMKTGSTIANCTALCGAQFAV